uniref:Ig-like domain-containing protein n=1 Tax=Salarias fasciatus TaxID=181472 RepID=A0A672G5P5_SALFA
MYLFLTGVFCSIWKVEYQHEFICAVKGSAVSIPCLFYSSDNQKVQRVLWGHVNAFGKKQIISTKSTGGVQYIGDKLHNCSIRIIIFYLLHSCFFHPNEGDSVKLTCVNSCDDSNASSAFTWFRNGESIYEGPFLHFRNMSPSVSGNYTCSLKTLLGTISRAVIINVGYMLDGPASQRQSHTFTIQCKVLKLRREHLEMLFPSETFMQIWENINYYNEKDI